MHGYSFAVPASGWTRSTASLSSLRSATIYLCDDDNDSNINMVSTPVASDFQKLTSFGGIDNVLVGTTWSKFALWCFKKLPDKLEGCLTFVVSIHVSCISRAHTDLRGRTRWFRAVGRISTAK